MVLIAALFSVFNIWWGPSPYRNPALAIVIVMLAAAVLVVAPDWFVNWCVSNGRKWLLYPVAVVFGVSTYVLVEFNTYHPWSNASSFAWILIDALIMAGFAYWYAQDPSPAERSGV